MKNCWHFEAQRREAVPNRTLWFATGPRVQPARAQRLRIASTDPRSVVPSFAAC